MRRVALLWAALVLVAACGNPEPSTVSPVADVGDVQISDASEPADDSGGPIPGQCVPSVCALGLQQGR